MEEQPEIEIKCQRVSPSASTRRKLWAECIGYCENPDCLRYLFFNNNKFDFGELAHIIAASSGGARDTSPAEMSSQERATSDNIIVLCPTCHTMVDKDEESFSVDLLKSWKLQRISAGERAVGTRLLGDRLSLWQELEPLMAENSLIHAEYAPRSGLHFSLADRWKDQVCRVVIPNNVKIYSLLHSNTTLLTSDERQILQKFDLHQKQFRERHINDNWIPESIMYPPEMDNILQECRK